MKVLGVGNCLEGGNIILVENNGVEEEYYTPETVLNIKNDMINLYSIGWVKITSLKRLNKK